MVVFVGRRGSWKVFYSCGQATDHTEEAFKKYQKGGSFYGVATLAALKKSSLQYSFAQQLPTARMLQLTWLLCAWHFVVEAEWERERVGCNFM